MVLKNITPFPLIFSYKVDNTNGNALAVNAKFLLLLLILEADSVLDCSQCIL